MNKKVFFTDLDGTLLNDEKEITPGNQEAIDLTLQRGHKIVIATGRPLASALIQAERLGLTKEGCYAITFNGAQIYDCFHHRTIYGKGVPRELAAPIFESALEKNIHIQTYTDTEVLAVQDRMELHEYIERTLQSYRIVPDISEALEADPYKILAIEEQRRDVIVQFQQELLRQYGKILDCYFSNDAYLEIVASDISKGNAVRWMCKFLDIPIENSVSAGDAPNDIGMIEAAHIGAAMCNSFPGVREHADYVTAADNNHDGAAEIIHKFILEDR